MKKYLAEVETKVKSIKSKQPPSKWKGENYVGGGMSKLKYLNHKIPLVREVSKNGFSFSKFDKQKQWKIWDYIWNQSEYFEVMLLSSYFAAQQSIEDLVKNDKIILGWLSRVDNWAHSDELSSHYSKLLETNAKKYLKVFRKWSKSTKPWFKRQSMVGLLFYSRFRKSVLPLKTLLSFVDQHMFDEHYYVQKGVGWTLRECWNVYPKETFAYLKKHAHNIPSAGWTAATEKLSAKDKKTLMVLRKKKRRGLK